jgi:CelD/BcsL family acetyltransferase involved in cellulose biosynthesis
LAAARNDAVSSAPIDDAQLRFEYLDSFAELQQYRRAWGELADEAGLDPGKQLDWLEATWTQLGAGKRLHIKVVHHDGTVVGFAPLVVHVEQRKGIPTRLLQPLGMLNPNLGTQFVLKPGYETACMRALFTDLKIAGPKWDLLFSYMLRDEPQAVALRETLAELGLHYLKQPAERPPFMPLAGSWEQLQAGLQSRFRTTLRSRERRLREKGTVELRFCDSPDTFRQGLDAIAAIEADSWKSESGLPITHEKHWAFYRDYAERASKSGALRLPILFVSSEPVAFDYGVFHAGKYHLIQTSFKHGWHDDYPGFVLRKLVIEKLITDGAHEINFGGSVSEWKSKWTATTRELELYSVFSDTVRARYLRVASAAARGLRKREAPKT